MAHPAVGILSAQLQYMCPDRHWEALCRAKRYQHTCLVQESALCVAQALDCELDMQRIRVKCLTQGAGSARWTGMLSSKPAAAQ